MFYLNLLSKNFQIDRAPLMNRAHEVILAASHKNDVVVASLLTERLGQNSVSVIECMKGIREVVKNKEEQTTKSEADDLNKEICEETKSLCISDKRKSTLKNTKSTEPCYEDYEKEEKALLK